MGLRGFCQVLVWVIVVISGACGPQRQGNSLRGWGPAAGARWGVGLGTMSRRGTEASDLGPGGRNGITGSPRGVREPTPICRVQTWSPRSWEEQTCSGGPVCPGESDAESLPTHGRHPEPVHLVLEFLPHPRQTFDLPRGGETPERIMSPASGGGEGGVRAGHRGPDGDRTCERGSAFCANGTAPCEAAWRVWDAAPRGRCRLNSCRRSYVCD